MEPSPWLSDGLPEYKWEDDGRPPWLSDECKREDNRTVPVSEKYYSFKEVFLLSEMQGKKSYTALYRHFRPRLFSEIVGQEHVTRTLQNALEKDRVAHAYLFCGLRGTGKTTMAKLLARALNCMEGVNREPCNKCRSCLEVLDGRNMDVFEIDAASNRGIDEIRDLREKARYASAQNRYKVYIVDEVHMLTNEAFNALLKILEEPPSKVIFILATTEIYKLPLTVVSRCQRFDFRLLEAGQIVGRLQQVASSIDFEIEEETLYLLARQAEGSMRDALGFLEQCRAYGGEQITYIEALEILGLAGPEVIYGLLQAVIEDNISVGLTTVAEVVGQGRDLQRFLRELILYLRRLILLQSGSDEEKTLRDVSGLRPYLLKHRGLFNSPVLLEMLEILQELHYQLRGSSQPQFLLELAFLRMTRAYRFRNYLSPGALLTRLEELEEKLQSAGLGQLTAAEKPEQALIKEESKKTELPSSNTEQDLPKTEETALPAAMKKSVQADQADQVDQNDNADQQMDPHQLNEFWEKRFLPEIKKKNRQIIYALLQEARPFSCRQGVLTASFPHTHGVHKSRIESPDNKKYLQSLLKTLMGKDMELRVILDENSVRRDAPKPGGRKREEYRAEYREADGHEKKMKMEIISEKPNKDYDSFMGDMLELFNGRILEAAGDGLESRDFWSFSLESAPLEIDEDDNPF
ncbi:MAG: DNA polymerase III subunit gamma/tau [Bacillota bacterium]|nr:DNA polymerase III subunit gamma/tau [Bacillota bacterium]